MDTTFDLFDSAVLEDNVDVELDVLDATGLDDTLQRLVDYPCAVLVGVDSEEEFQYFRNALAHSNVSLPLYCSIDGVLHRMGSLDLTLDSLLALRQIFNYRLFIRRSEQDSVEIDLNCPDTFCEFIKL